MKETNIKCGMLLKQCRKETSFRQIDVAESINCKEETISRWERGIGIDGLVQIAQLENMLGKSMYQIFESVLEDSEESEDLEE